MSDSLAKERAGATFPPQELSEVLYGGADGLKKYLHLHRLISEDPVFRRDDDHFLSRKDSFRRAIEKSTKLVGIMKKNNIKPFTPEYYILVRSIGIPIPFALHSDMFIPTIIGQGTPEQVQKWLPLAENYQILGTYAQTELGHGSFVRGLETTATYNPSTKTFTLHSPTLSSTKWWPGGLGVVSNHAVVMARLITKGKDYGPHPFFVQLRSLEDHKPMPGIIVGDIGPKFGYNTNDNGFLRFDNYTIPRENMLMKFSQVSEDGTYHRPPHSKLAYGTMVGVRVGIIGEAMHYLGRAVTISIRYSAVRKQFPKVISSQTSSTPQSLPEEEYILNYQTQQHKLLPLLATAYAFHFTQTKITQLLTTFQQQAKTGNFLLIQQLHAASSGLKSLTTSVVCDGIEVCRKACGGHGYSKFSGLPDLYANYTPSVTYEGENTVMYLQTARFLIKMFAQSQQAAQSGSQKSSKGLAFFDPKFVKEVLSERCLAKKPEDLLDPDTQIRIFCHRFVRMTAEVARKLQEQTQNGVSMGQAMDNCQVAQVQAATAYCWYLVQMNFANAVRLQDTDELKGVSPNTLNVLRDLLYLFTFSHIERFSGEFTEDGFLSSEQMSWVRHHLRNYLFEVRKNAVSLVDAFQLSDHILDSALGAYDGRYAERLYELVVKEPLNNVYPPIGYNEYIKPLLNGDIYDNITVSKL